MREWRSVEDLVRERLSDEGQACLKEWGSLLKKIKQAPGNMELLRHFAVIGTKLYSPPELVYRGSKEVKSLVDEALANDPTEPREDLNVRFGTMVEPHKGYWAEAIDNAKAAMDRGDIEVRGRQISPPTEIDSRPSAYKRDSDGFIRPSVVPHIPRPAPFNSLIDTDTVAALSLHVGLPGVVGMQGTAYSNARSMLTTSRRVYFVDLEASVVHMQEPTTARERVCQAILSAPSEVAAVARLETTESGRARRFEPWVRDFFASKGWGPVNVFRQGRGDLQVNFRDGMRDALSRKANTGR